MFNKLIFTMSGQKRKNVQQTNIYFITLGKSQLIDLSQQERLWVKKLLLGPTLAAS